MDVEWDRLGLVLVVTLVGVLVVTALFSLGMRALAARRAAVAAGLSPRRHTVGAAVCLAACVAAALYGLWLIVPQFH